MSEPPSGLELDGRPARKAPRPSASELAARATRPALRRPRPGTEDEDNTVDSANGGAFIVIVIAHLVLGLIAASQAPGDAVLTLGLIVASAVVTFVGYWITGWLANQFGFIALVFLGGWFSLLIGMIAQGVHQLFPWLGWKVLGVLVALAFAIAFVLDR